MKILNFSSRKYITALLDSSPDPLEVKIDSFAKLDHGWHFCEGNPPTLETIMSAKNIYRIGKYLGLKSDAFPSINQGITIVFYGHNDHNIELNIDNNHQITISYEIGYGFEYKEEFFEENTTIDTIKTQCKKLLPPTKRNLLELSTHGYLIKGEVVSQAIASRIQQGTVGFPSLMGIVSSKPTMPQYVHI